MTQQRRGCALSVNDRSPHWRSGSLAMHQSSNSLGERAKWQESLRSPLESGGIPGFLISYRLAPSAPLWSLLNGRRAAH
jgi:hypothetical protein